MEVEEFCPSITFAWLVHLVTYFLRPVTRGAARSLYKRLQPKGGGQVWVGVATVIELSSRQVGQHAFSGLEERKGKIGDVSFDLAKRETVFHPRLCYLLPCMYVRLADSFIFSF